MSNEKVIRLVPESVGEDYFVPPDHILADAIGEYVSVVVVGELANGQIEVVGSSNVGEANLLLDHGKKTLLNGL